MKTTNALTTFMLLASLSFSTLVKAEDVVIPVIAKPSVLQEGTQRELTANQIAELLPWAKNSKVFLNELLNSVQGLSSVDKLERFEDGIKSVVVESAPKNSELLMRYILNRALVVNDLLKSEINADQTGAVDTKLRVLTSSIKMAIDYYDTDIETLKKKSNVPFINFGIQYFNFLSELNKSIFDASASYYIQRTALEWLQWDLYRDLNNQTMAPQIVKINNALKIYSVKKMSDAQYINGIKQMKLLSQSLYEDNLATQCASTFSNPTFSSSCAREGIRYNLDVELIQICGNIFSTTIDIDKCVTSIRGKKATSYNMTVYKNCGSFFSADHYKLSCIEVYNVYSLPTKNLVTCADEMNSDSERISCLTNI
ncbi:hypothetical protein SHI21_11890 [Bacteriovorax sp. PP10]|uniref:Uncharacterized protein n=1 Tax=Bacteriovorax antarcticus TaxID=3088717 RepID=A0ABU5VY29_9BACT|nr:hypothetical protein [Bacteriovorax sp. PP10]MEA9356915.1 hypothetical protein [Bacteriovorax sp. PP10]